VDDKKETGEYNRVLAGGDIFKNKNPDSRECMEGKRRTTLLSSKRTNTGRPLPKGGRKISSDIA